MQTLTQKFKFPESNLKAEALMNEVRSRVALAAPTQSAATQDSIVCWLLGEDLARYETLNSTQMKIAQQAIVYLYRILQQRYLGNSPQQAYRNLITRLSSLTILRNKIYTWVTLNSCDAKATVIDVLQELIPELLQSDRYLQQQMIWIAKCTSDRRLQNALLFASLEEYCLRPICNKPLLVYRLINYMRRTSKRGITQAPRNNLSQLVFEEISTVDSECEFNILDIQAFAQYQYTQAMLVQEMLRIAVQQEFSAYLAQNLGALAVRWFQLYLQGQSQKDTAQSLNLQPEQVYQLRQKVGYHAIHNFARKCQPELVSDFLKT